MHTGHRENGLDLLSVLSTSDDLWSPRTVAVLNDYDVRPAKTRGAFPRHSHPETDELFLVLSGSLTIRMDAGDVQLGPGKLSVVPRASSISRSPLRSGDPAHRAEHDRQPEDAPGALTAQRRLV